MHNIMKILRIITLGFIQLWNQFYYAYAVLSLKTSTCPLMCEIGETPLKKIIEDRMVSSAKQTKQKVGITSANL